MALLAILLQVLAIYGPLGNNDSLRGVVLILSYLTLMVFVAANWKRIGIAIIGIGLLMNFTPIAANGGLMPITPETLAKTGLFPHGTELNQRVPDSKDVLKRRDDTHFYFLSDRLVWTDLSPAIRAFSLGDVVIVSGLIVMLGDLLLPRLRKDAPGQGSNPGHPESKDPGI